MQSERTQFEVQCRRCKVSFPIETRVCIHCGGPTSASSDTQANSESARPVFDFDSRFEDVEDRGSWQSATGTETGGPRSRGSDAIPLEDLEPDAPTPGIGRSILGSMGSLIWIALLIAFSLSGRICGGE